MKKKVALKYEYDKAAIKEAFLEIEGKTYGVGSLKDMFISSKTHLQEFYSENCHLFVIEVAKLLVFCFFALNMRFLKMKIFGLEKG